MRKIAIDVVLLLPEEVEDKAIAINKELVKIGPENIIFEREKCVPHASLCMAVIDEKDLNKIENVLKEILRNFDKLHLEILGIKSKINPLGKISNSFDIAKDKELQRLHEEIMIKLSPFFHKEAAEENFFLPLKYRELTIRWTEEYPETSAFEKFKPHVSLGFGELQENVAPFSFTSSRIAVFQMGDYCTCKKKLIELGMPV